MSLAADIGRNIKLKLTTGQEIQARLTFGDFARAEIETGTNYMTAITQGGVAINLTDVAQLCYQAAHRTGQFGGTFDEWLILIEDFPDIEVPEDAEENVAPFPPTQAATS